MNRLIIIGNGFDLAHGLPTSYRNFIDDFWKNFKEKCLEKEYGEIAHYNESYNGFFDYGQINDFAGFLSNIKRYAENYRYHFDEKSFRCYTHTSAGKRHTIFDFKNNFFKLINEKNSQNWVDIENEYYNLLKEIVNKQNIGKDIKKGELLKLNKEFEQVKNLLERYLKEKIIDKYNFDEYNDSHGDFFKFYDIFYPQLMSTNDDVRNDYLEDFSNSDRKNIEYSIMDGSLQVRLHFLSFNYTPTLAKYIRQFHEKSRINVDVNFIHGIVGNKTDNKINFGFGDEMDEDYKVIENIDDNEYLKYFKSFQYLQNSNYKNLLNFVESEKFEVYILGASCGLSDRTLLNTIFENNNCRLIKVFYYKNDEYDNFTELGQNISRHFNKKALMRTKIFHKSEEQVMPQVQLPLK